MTDRAPALAGLASRAVLNDGNALPWVGLGVYSMGGSAASRQAVAHALASGYRHIDTAALYGNEAEVGRAVRESGIPREEIFVVTKLWNSDQGYASALAAFDTSLARLGLDYVDLYLIHWPEPGKRRESWRALREIRRSGRCRSIGVSNYTVGHLTELLAESEVVPAVNQVEFSPFLYQRELLELCRERGVQLVAYCPLTRGERLGEPAIVEVARRHGRTPAQIVLRWALQHGVAVIPKSSRPPRIDENARLFDFSLDERDMAVLDALNEDYRVCWDPTGVP